MSHHIYVIYSSCSQQVELWSKSGQWTCGKRNTRIFERCLVCENRVQYLLQWQLDIIKHNCLLKWEGEDAKQRWTKMPPQLHHQALWLLCSRRCCSRSSHAPLQKCTCMQWHLNTAAQCFRDQFRVCTEGPTKNYLYKCWCKTGRPLLSSFIYPALNRDSLTKWGFHTSSRHIR